jgi:hypothetical protein
MAKPVNDSTGSPPHSSSASADAALSAYVFSNPQEFLQTLKNDFHKFGLPERRRLDSPGDAIVGPDSITENDLIAYAHNGDDPKDRAAAQIAADHFDQLRRMSGSAALSITEDDLDVDMRLLQGRTTKEIAENVLGDGTLALVTGITAAVSGTGAVLLSETPPVALGCGALALLMGSATGLEVVMAFKEPGRIKALAKQDQQLLYSWKGINGSK